MYMYNKRSETYYKQHCRCDDQKRMGPEIESGWVVGADDSSSSIVPVYPKVILLGICGSCQVYISVYTYAFQWSRLTIADLCSFLSFLIWYPAFSGGDSDLSDPVSIWETSPNVPLAGRACGSCYQRLHSSRKRTNPPPTPWLVDVAPMIEWCLPLNGSIWMVECWPLSWSGHWEVLGDRGILSGFVVSSSLLNASLIWIRATIEWSGER